MGCCAAVGSEYGASFAAILGTLEVSTLFRP